jgi:hypothetical protein
VRCTPVDRSHERPDPLRVGRADEEVGELAVMSGDQLERRFVLRVRFDPIDAPLAPNELQHSRRKRPGAGADIHHRHAGPDQPIDHPIVLESGADAARPVPPDTGTRADRASSELFGSCHLVSSLYPQGTPS